MEYAIGVLGTVATVLLALWLLMRRWDKEAEQKDPTEFKPFITVLGINNIPKQRVKTTYGGRYGNGETYSESQLEQTIVLYSTLDGVVHTKTFTGKWTLDQMKNWIVEKEK